MSDPLYEHTVAEALTTALARAQQQAPLTFNLRTDRALIVSDLHRGARNGADDFVRSERAYNAALAHYFELGHTLMVLGDAEELWEEYPQAVMRTYPHTFELEAQFHQAGRYVRVWGNHDDDWASADNVRRWLEPALGAPVTVNEHMCVNITDDDHLLGQLFLTHGHQGDTASDQWSQVSRWLVRYFWRPVQRLTRISANTPARDWQLREKHNIALYRWAEQQTRLVLIAGHTHRPVFKSKTHAEQIVESLQTLRHKLHEAPDDARLQEIVARQTAELEWVRAQDGLPPSAAETVVPMSKPCYFNTGCCCFADGDITGLELADGEIRLVRWPDKHGRPRPHLLARAPLRDILSQL